MAKRAVGFILAAVLILSTASAASPKGDLNGDGKVGKNDLTALWNGADYFRNGTEASDLNGDGAAFSKVNAFTVAGNPRQTHERY